MDFFALESATQSAPPVVRSWPWPRFLEWLDRERDVSALRGVDAAKAKRHRSRHLPAFAPVKLRDPKVRAGRNVESLSALVLDFDQGGDLETVLDRWDGWERFAYTTWSHRPEAPRCRLVLPLAVPIPAEHWPALYAPIAEKNGSDVSCSDPGRIHFVPAEGLGGPHKRVHVPGRYLDLSERYEAVRAAQVAAQVAEGRARRERVEERRRRNAELERKTGGLRPDLYEELKFVDIRVVAEALGYAADEVSVACPACGRVERGRRRGGRYFVHLYAGDKDGRSMWSCRAIGHSTKPGSRGACGESGDAVGFLAWHVLQRDAKTRDDFRRLRACAVESGLPVAPENE